jgi:uncharacterized protein (DUF433 family)
MIAIVKKSTAKNEYPDLTAEQVIELVGYLKQGLSEEEAIAKIKENE